MNFDFSALNFETIDSNINAYPDMFLNQNGVTFTKKVLEDLGYPAFVLCLLDAKARVFAIRSCKSNEPKGFKFSKPRGEQKCFPAYRWSTAEYSTSRKCVTFHRSDCIVTKWYNLYAVP